ncbi:hypothetical protein GE09DRAFT_1268856 [Coniochaeta sp. 2T2.1]|nr:hypothetical protein GE09DRAFT_1268856 [Coniochaeta sp. 2T2.1]
MATVKLKLGFFLMKNPSPEEAGVLALFLQDLLNKHIERELPEVREEIKRYLAVTEAELSSIGPERPTAVHIRYFLTDVSMRFHRLAEAAMEGNYQGPEMDFFKAPNTRLRAEVHETNGKFAEHMRVSGQKRKVSTEGPHMDADGESTDENEVQQLHVTKKDMVAWVYEVRASSSPFVELTS